MRHLQISLLPRLDGKVVLIDAGHGGNDVGATRLGIREKDITLRIALQLKQSFIERGATVYLTRDKDIDLSLAEICAIVAARQPDVFICVHVNSSAGTTSTSGIQTYMRTDISRLLAHTVHAHLLRATNANDGKVHSAHFWVLNSLAVPSLLIETGYIKCRPDRKRLLDSRYRQLICDGIVNGVTAYWQKKGLLKKQKLKGKNKP